jgi:predicted RND superfamily exporter protein
MTMGITGYLGITVTVVTMVAAAMILGLGIDFGIHTMHTYAHYHEKHNSRIATIKTLQELFRAQLAASMTTSAGFLALGLGVLPAMANLGVVLAIGVSTTFITATLLLPAIITISHS